MRNTSGSRSGGMTVKLIANLRKPKQKSCRDIAEIYDRFEMLNQQLELLSGLAQQHSMQWKSISPARTHAEQDLDTALWQMRELSSQAAEIKAKCVEHLRFKAKMLLIRQIPDASDDVTCLATSICEDLLALQVAFGTDLIEN
jgi:DNA polymerase III gamma/tau subunit